MPVLGMMLAFKNSASAVLADIPAQVIQVWPPVHAGDHLVTLEYAQPVKFKDTFIRHIDAFVSDLYQPAERQSDWAMA
jgi:hypothetical protein